MQRSLIKIANRIAIESHFDEIDSIIGSEDKNAKLILQCIENGIERDIWHHHPWAILRRFYTFTEASRKQQYDLPTNFGWYVNDTAWETGDEKKRMLGPLDPYQWQIRTIPDYSTPQNRTAFMFAGANDLFSAGGLVSTEDYNQKIMIDPMPDFLDSSEAKSYSMAFISDRIVLDDIGSAKNLFTKDSDIPVFDSNLVELAGLIRLKRSIGMNFADHFDELQSLLAHWGRKDRGMKRMSANTPRESRWRPNIPVTGLG